MLKEESTVSLLPNNATDLALTEYVTPAIVQFKKEAPTPPPQNKALSKILAVRTYAVREGRRLNGMADFSRGIPIPLSAGGYNRTKTLFSKGICGQSLAKNGSNVLRGGEASSVDQFGVLWKRDEWRTPFVSDALTVRQSKDNSLWGQVKTTAYWVTHPSKLSSVQYAARLLKSSYKYIFTTNTAPKVLYKQSKDPQLSIQDNLKLALRDLLERETPRMERFEGPRLCDVKEYFRYLSVTPRDKWIGIETSKLKKLPLQRTNGKFSVCIDNSSYDLIYTTNSYILCWNFSEIKGTNKANLNTFKAFTDSGTSVTLLEKALLCMNTDLARGLLYEHFVAGCDNSSLLCSGNFFKFIENAPDKRLLAQLSPHITELFLNSVTTYYKLLVENLDTISHRQQALTASLTKSLTSVEEHNRLLSKENARLSTALTLTENKSLQRANALEKEKKDIQQTLSLVTKDCDNHKKSLLALQNEYKNLEQELKTLQTIEKELQLAISTSTTSKKETEVALTKSEIKALELKKSVQTLTTELEMAHKEISTLKEELQSHAKAYTNLVQTVEKLNLSHAVERNAANSLIASQAADLTSVNERLKATEESKSSLTLRAVEEKRDAECKIATLNSKVHDYAIKLATSDMIKAENVGLKEQISSLQTSLATKNDDIKVLKEQVRYAELCTDLKEKSSIELLRNKKTNELSIKSLQITIESQQIELNAAKISLNRPTWGATFKHLCSLAMFFSSSAYVLGKAVTPPVQQTLPSTTNAPVNTNPTTTNNLLRDANSLKNAAIEHKEISLFGVGLYLLRKLLKRG
jgi:hypothetical protein